MKQIPDEVREKVWLEISSWAAWSEPGQILPADIERWASVFNAAVRDMITVLDVIPVPDSLVDPQRLGRMIGSVPDIDCSSIEDWLYREHENKVWMYCQTGHGKFWAIWISDAPWNKLPIDGFWRKPTEEEIKICLEDKNNGRLYTTHASEPDPAIGKQTPSDTDNPVAVETATNFGED